MAGQRTRYYDPGLGRFCQREPVGTDGYNVYVYVHSVPTTFQDPTGFVTVSAKFGWKRPADANPVLEMTIKYTWACGCCFDETGACDGEILMTYVDLMIEHKGDDTVARDELKRTELVGCGAKGEAEQKKPSEYSYTLKCTAKEQPRLGCFEEYTAAYFHLHYKNPVAVGTPHVADTEDQVRFLHEIWTTDGCGNITGSDNTSTVLGSVGQPPVTIGSVLGFPSPPSHVIDRIEDFGVDGNCKVEGKLK